MFSPIVTAVLTKYYNEGTYTRDTVINMNEKAQAELISCFHAEVNILNRTTYFTPDALWMSHGNEDSNYSYYGTADGNMTSGTATEALVAPEKVSVAKTGTTMEGYYTTMADISDTSTTAVKWTKSRNVWSCDYDDVIKKFLDFTAPCFLGLSDDKAEYFSLDHVEVEESGDSLLLRLVTTGDSGKLTDANGVLSVATITK